MRELLVIGMGPGHPDQVTVQAVQALNRVDVFFRIDKGDAKSGLNAARAQILARHVTRTGWRMVDVPEPLRDRSALLDRGGYEGAVGDWHQARAELIGAAVAAELGPDGVGAFLVWGDPSVYDSMLRIIDRVLASGVVEFEYSVLPGVTSVQALAAAHRIPLNRVGEPIHITPARRIAGGLPSCASGTGGSWTRTCCAGSGRRSRTPNWHCVCPHGVSRLRASAEARRRLQSAWQRRRADLQ